MSYRDEALAIVEAGALRTDLKNVSRYEAFLDDEDFLIEAVSLDPTFITEIDHPSVAVMKAAIVRDPSVFGCSPIIERQTDELALAAVSKEGHLLPLVKHQTEVICLAAIKSCASAMKAVEPRFLTIRSFLEMAITYNVDVVQYIDADKLDDELCFRVILTSAAGIYLVLKKRAVTPEMLLAALNNLDKEEDTKQSASAIIREIPEETILLTLKQQPDIFRLIPEDKMSLNVIVMALRRDGMNIRFLPAERQTAKLAGEAVKQNPAAIEMAVPEVVTADVVKLALADPSDIALISDVMQMAPNANPLDVCKELGLSFKNKI